MRQGRSGAYFGQCSAKVPLPQGLITLHHLQSVPHERPFGLTTSQITTPIEGVLRVHPDDDLFRVLQRMDENDVNGLLRV